MTFAPVGLYRVDAIGLLSQLAREKVVDFVADEDDAADIVTALLALQEHPNPITEGDITISGTRSLTIPYDTILGAIQRLHESVGGYYWVDGDGAFHWTPDIGEDTGQILRLGRNLTSVRLTTDYSELRNRLYCYGAGDGEARVRLGKGQSITRPLVSSDVAAYYYERAPVSEWRFSLGGWGGRIIVGYPFSSYSHAGGAARFPDVKVPQGATILAARLVLTAHGTPGSGSSVNSRVYGENVDNAGSFTNAAGYNTRRANATTKYTWDSIESWTGGSEYTFNVQPIVQAIVNRGGWSNGNAMAIWWEDHERRTTDALQSRRARADVNSQYSPRLEIDFEEAGAVDYIEDAASIEQYGFAGGPPLVEKAITDPATLFEWAVRQLSILAYPHVSYAASAVDLSALGFALDAIGLGNQVRLLADAIGLNAKTRIVSVSRDILDAMNVSVELSNRERTVLDKMNFAADPRWRVHFY
jgi:hypothetical protein